MQLFLALVKEDKNESLAWMALMATTHTHRGGRRTSFIFQGVRICKQNIKQQHKSQEARVICYILPLTGRLITRGGNFDAAAWRNPNTLSACAPVKPCPKLTICVFKVPQNFTYVSQPFALCEQLRTISSAQLVLGKLCVCV